MARIVLRVYVLVQAETFVDARSAEDVPGLGPAMRFALLLARFRVAPPQLVVMPYGHEAPDAAVCLPPVTLLWELAERYHPEQTWLAELWTRGERSLEEIGRTAPREALAVGFIEAARRAEAKGLWSSPSTTGAPVRARNAVVHVSKGLVLLGHVWGLRASLRNAFLGKDDDRSDSHQESRGAGDPPLWV